MNPPKNQRKRGRPPLPKSKKKKLDKPRQVGRWPEKHWKQIKKAAAKRGIPVSDLFRLAIEEYLGDELDW